jgi:DNA processing protein
MLSRDELAAWLRLSDTRGLGRATARRMLAAFGSPEGVLAADEAALCEFVSANLAGALLARHARLEAQVDLTRRWLEAAPADAARDVVVLGDPRYPDLLLQTADPPLLLYTSGRAELLCAPSLAIVGSRRATPQGLDNAGTFARLLSDRGWTIVSGLALGIDGAAHASSLAGPGGTVAFVATGLDQVYPRRHTALARDIERSGLVASEYPLGMDALAINFPRRNRLIAGISQGTLVVEAALQSGSLITARMALESNREVFAIPGSIQSPQAQGCHLLIRQGATLVETVDDILEQLQAPRPPASARMGVRQASLFATTSIDEPEVEPEERGPDAALLAALGHDPVTFDALAARTGLPSERLAARLLDLELGGTLQRLPGGLLQRRASA